MPKRRRRWRTIRPPLRGAAGPRRAADFGRRAQFRRSNRRFAAPDVRDIPVENVRPSEIKVDGLKPLGERPTAKWMKRVVMALLGLCGAMAAAAWQHYGDQAKAMAAEWAPPFVLAALPSATRPAVAEQPSAPASRDRRNGSGRRATAGSGGSTGSTQPSRHYGR